MKKIIMIFILLTSINVYAEKVGVDCGGLKLCTKDSECASGFTCKDDTLYTGCKTCQGSSGVGKAINTGNSTNKNSTIAPATMQR